MAQTNFTGPLASGDPGAVGLAVLAQTVRIDANNTTSQTATVRLPRNTRILDFYPDVRTVFNGTTPVLAAGIAAAGTQYLSAIALGTAGRRPLGLSATQVEALQSTGSNRDLVFTVSAGTANSAGILFVTVLYVQTTADD